MLLIELGWEERRVVLSGSNSGAASGTRWVLRLLVHLVAVHNKAEAVDPAFLLALKLRYICCSTILLKGICIFLVCQKIVKAYNFFHGIEALYAPLPKTFAKINFREV